MSNKLIFLFLGLVVVAEGLSACVSVERDQQRRTLAQAASCQSSLHDWLQMYGDSDPFLAQNKTRPWKISLSTLASVAKGQKDFSQSDVPNLGRGQGRDEARVLSFALAEYEPPDERTLKLRKNIGEFFKARSLRQDSLAIIYVGDIHSMDLFLSDPKLSVTYVSKPFSFDTPTITPEFKEFALFLNQRTMLDQLLSSPVRESAITLFTVPYSTTVSSLKSLGKKQLPSQTLIPQNRNERRWVIGETHQVVSTEWIEQLPSADCLRSLGIVSIKLGLEAFPKGTLSFDQVLKHLTYQDQFEAAAKSSGKTLEQLLVNFPESIRKNILAGKITHNIAMLAFVKRIKLYYDAGIDVELSGLE
ncbi:MAG TPA: hypothetical protein VN132_01650 [Bdellovibrio sp.]|nr:hypothetical protein [Bdellovibrio sp.]